MSTTRPKKRSTPEAPPPTRAEQFAAAFTGFESQLLTHLQAAGTWARKHLRMRTVAVWVLPLLAVVALWLTNPDRGMLSGRIDVPPVLVWLLMIAKGAAYIAIAHFLCKAIFDYADRKTLLAQALRGNVAAAISFATLVGAFLALVFFLGAQTANGAEVPAQAKPYLTLLKSERQKNWNDHPAPEVLAGLIDHESGCPNGRKCWNPRTEFNGKFKGTEIRSERGVGLGQITVAWRRDGSVRMDALQDMVKRHPALAGWSWANVYDPGYQMRAIVLMSQDNFKALRAVRDPLQRVRMADAAYNGGLGGLQAERRACGLKTGCDPQRWAGNVERTCLKSTAALYGSRSACDINRFHVADVIDHRAPKYRGLV